MVRVANKPFHTNALAFPEDSLYFDMNRSSSGTVKINLVRALCSEELRRKMGVEKVKGEGKRRVWNPKERVAIQYASRQFGVTYEST